MLQLVERIDRTTNGDTQDVDIYDTLTLPYELRIRSRLKAKTNNERDVGLFLDRGLVLRHKDLLAASTGEVIQILAADEPVTTAYIDGSLSLARLTYHLGNRHVSLAIGSDNDGRYWVRFPPDHVLEELARLLGAEVVHHYAPFDPESGAYAHITREHVLNHGDSASENHNHSHSHGHDYERMHTHS